MTGRWAAGEVITLASTLEGQIRLKDGGLVVFVEPETVPCHQEACGPEHHWLDGPTLRRCPGQPTARVAR